MGLNFGGYDSNTSYGGPINVMGFGQAQNRLAGRYLDPAAFGRNLLTSFGLEDDEEAKRDLASTAFLGSILEGQKQTPEEIGRIFEQLEGPLKRIGEQKQRFGLQSNLIGAGINAISQIPQTINAMRAIPLQSLAAQTQQLPGTFAAYGNRPVFGSGIRSRLGRA